VRHRHRRFGPGPYLTGLRKDPSHWGVGFPFDVPAVDAIETLDERGLAPCAYGELDTVRLMRGFLDAPDRYLRAALGE
jgi:hypothetical protein